MGRPAKPSAEKLIRNVNIALTEAQYQYFKKLAGHTDPILRVGSQKPMPARQRSIASLIREHLNHAWPEPAAAETVADGQVVAAIAAMADALHQLAINANDQGYATVASQTTQLTDQLRNPLKRYGQPRR